MELKPFGLNNIMNYKIRLLVVVYILLIGVVTVLSLIYNWDFSRVVPFFIFLSFLVLMIIIFHYKDHKLIRRFLPNKKPYPNKDSKNDKDIKVSDGPVIFEPTYRERNSGVTWNRESLHSANSTRGSYRKFLRSFKK